MWNNEFKLIGRLGKDAELKHTKNGASFVTFSLAINAWYKDPYTTAQIQKTEWFHVSCWGKIVTFASELKKGDQVLAIGQCEVNRWTDNKDIERETPGLKAHTVLKLAKRSSPDKDGKPTDSGEEDVAGAFQVDYVVDHEL